MFTDAMFEQCLRTQTVMHVARAHSLTRCTWVVLEAYECMIGSCPIDPVERLDSFNYCEELLNKSIAKLLRMRSR